ncbi:MAG: GntR family transcriptional regulator [Hyphomicrobiaceae bacterium]
MKTRTAHAPAGSRDMLSMRVERTSLTLRERAADVIRQAIIDHRLPPGTHLKERELCEMLGVSRTSVREALRHLETEQLITTVPHRGPVVVSLSVEDAQQLYQVRAVLEGLVGEQFALKASDSQIAELKRLAVGMAASVRRDQPDATLAIIADFYAVLFEGAGNRVCAQFLQSLNTRISILRRLSLSSKGRPKAMLKEVEEIIAAAAARDPKAMKQACIRHVEGACQAVVTQLVPRSAPARERKRSLVDQNG